MVTDARTGGAARISRRSVLMSAAALGGCAGIPWLQSVGASAKRTANPLLPALASADYVALGEVHDNAEQHRLRAAWLEEAAARSRFALAIEQLDADRQSDLDRARPAGTTDGTRAWAEAAGFSFDGWQWPYYEPYFRLALARSLPLFAANLSSREVGRIARAPAADARAPAIPRGWGEAEQSRMEREIGDGHCGLLPGRALAPMASAQRARDARMAAVMVEARKATGLPVILLAGNGHTRRDIGVPLHLRDVADAGRIASVGLLERRPAEAGAREAAPDRPWDVVVWTDAQPREDPCVGLRARFRPAG